VRFESLNKLWEAARQDSHDFRVATDIFPTFDIQKAANSLDLVKEAKRRGAEDRPPTDAISLDEIEKQIIEMVESEKKTGHQLLEDQFHVFSDRLASLDFEGHFSKIRQTIATSVSDFKAEVASGKDDLHILRNRLHEARQEKSAFKKEHGISRAARISSKAWKFVKIALLLVLFMVETALNGTFLAEGSEQGLVGGISIALGFSFINIGVALLVAIFCARLANHRSFFLKAVGSASIAVYFFAAFIMNLSLAHYREASHTSFAEASTQVIARMKQAPLDLADINSWILLLIGLLFATIAFIDGLLLVDPYPGFSGVETRARAAQEAYRSKKEDLIGGLKEIRDEHNEKVAEIVNNLSKRRMEHSAVINHRERVANLFNTYQSQLETSANALLQIYRSANRQARMKEAPQHFQHEYQLIRVVPSATLPGEWDDTQLAAQIRESQHDLNEQISLVSKEFQAGVESYHQLDDLYPDQMNG